MNRPLVLASSSPYRRQLLERLQLAFDVAAPNIDETPLKHESPMQLVKRLSADKAIALQARFPHALIIGSDQCVVLGSRVLGKPGSYESAREQLRASSGQEVKVYTGLCLFDAATHVRWLDIVQYEIAYRTLEVAEIEHYLRVEKPYDCAGSVKSEGLGVSLLRHMRGDDPTALVGLPLIRLCEMLRAAGMQIPPESM